MEKLLKTILTDIATHPDAIQVEEQTNPDDPSFVTFLITAHEEDKGLIIGKGGRTISSIRDVLSIKAVRENKKVKLEIVD